MARALVTGGAGFIGSHLVDRLLDEGHEVIALDDLSSGKLDNLAAAQGRPGFSLEVADITTPALDAVVDARRPEFVFHLAAQIDVRRSVADPLHDAAVNVLGTVRLLEACRRADTRKVILTTSGGCIYGEPEPHELPVTEDYIGHAHSPYGASKRAAEEYLHTYAALYGLQWTSLALANVYGPRQDPSGEAGVVSIFAGRMLRGEPVTIYGNGEQTRDFVYVGDVVDAFIRALDAGDGLRLNIGTGEQTRVRDLFAKLATLTGYRTDPRHEPARVGELRHIALATAQAERAVGWKPLTTLPDGLFATIQWLREKV